MSLTSERAPLTLVPFSDAPRPALDLTIPPWPGEYVDTDGVQLHIRRTPGPQEDPAVFVHGLGGSSLNWTDLAAQLSGHAAGVAIDLPGAGYTEPPKDYVFDLNTHADVTAEFIRSMGRPVHLFGNSMGGAVSMIVAAKYPELVRTLTLVSPAVPDLRPYPTRMSDPRIPFAMMPFIGPRYRAQLAALTPMQRAEQLVRLCFADPAMVPAHRMHETAAEFEARAKIAWAGPALMRTTLALFRAWLVPPSRSLWRIVPKITAPTLVVWGAQDKLVTVRKAPRTARLLPKGRLLVLPRTGHVAQIERPETVARAVLGMWEAVAAGRW